MENGRNEIGGRQLVAGYLGVVLMLIGGIILLPLAALPAFWDEVSMARYFTVPGVAAVFAGYVMYLPIKGREALRLTGHQDALIVVLSWVLAIVFCAVPFMMTGNYDFTQAVFECTSGWSTTGLSVVDVTRCPRIFLLYRSIMLFFGGVGLVLVMVSVLSDRHGIRLYSAEGHSDRLLPNLVKSARMIIAIYMGYILSGTLLYMFFGMDWFDGLNHSIAALSTGGFSTKAESIGYYDSLGIELVTIVLMLLGCTNFLAHLFLIRGKLKTFFRYCEVRFMLMICGFFTPVMAVLLLYAGLSGNVGQGFRDGLFQVVTALTTTGFQTVDSFAAFSSPLLLVMTLLMLVGGGTGSTAGGIKQIRVWIALKSLYWSMRSRISRKRTVYSDSIQKLDGKEFLTARGRLDTLEFIGVYLSVFMLGTMVLCMCGFDIGDSMFEFASALGTVGLSVGITSYDASPAVLWTETAGMFVGRLEIYVVFVAAVQLGREIKHGAQKRGRRWKKYAR